MKTKIIIIVITIIIGSILCSHSSYAENFNIPLKQGENLISIPVNPTDTSITRVLNSINGLYGDVWSFDPNDTADPWKHYHPEHVGESDLTEIKPSFGYRIFVTRDCMLTVEGAPISTYTLNLKQGWNLIGWPFLRSQDITEVLEGVAFDQVSRINPITKEQEDYYGNPATDAFTTFDPGRGYYINCLFPATVSLQAPAGGTATTTEEPWIDVRNYPSLKDAISAIGGEEKTLLIPNGQAVSSNLAVPSNITLKFLQGGKLSINPGITVTINGYVDAGLYQIFSDNGKVTLGLGAVKEVYPQWWGASGDQTRDDTKAIQSAIDAAVGGQIVRLPAGIYRINNTITISGEGKRIILRGDGRHETPPYTRLMMTAPGTMLKLDQCKYVVIEDMYVDGNYLATLGIDVNKSVNYTINRLLIGRCETGISFTGAYCGTLKDSDIRWNKTGFLVNELTDGQDNNALWIQGVICSANTWGGVINGGYGINIIGCTFDCQGYRCSHAGCIFDPSLKGGGIKFGSVSEPNVRSTKITHCYFESNPTSILIGDSAATKRIEDTIISYNNFLTGWVDDATSIKVDKAAGTIISFNSYRYGSGERPRQINITNNAQTTTIIENKSAYWHKGFSDSGGDTTILEMPEGSHGYLAVSGNNPVFSIKGRSEESGTNHLRFDNHYGKTMGEISQPYIGGASKLSINAGSYSGNSGAIGLKVDNNEMATIDSSGVNISGGRWNEGHLRLGNYHFWVDGGGRLRIKDSTPTSDTDGTVVGTQ